MSTTFPEPDHQDPAEPKEVGTEQETAPQPEPTVPASEPNE